MSLWYWFTYMSQAIRGSIWCFWGVRWLTAGQQVTWAQFWTQKVDFGSSYCTYSGAKSCSLPGRLNPCFWLAVQEKGLGCKPFLCQNLWKDLETGRNCQKSYQMLSEILEYGLQFTFQSNHWIVWKLTNLLGENCPLVIFWVLGPFFVKFQILGTWSPFQNADLIFSWMSSLMRKQAFLKPG